MSVRLQVPQSSKGGSILETMASAEQQRESLNIQLLVDSIPALIHTGRPDGYLDYFNKPWLTYFGVTLDKVVGWNWTAVIHPEDVEGILAQWRACLVSGETFEYESRVRRANGEYRWMFHRKVPLRDADGNIVKWYGSSLDIEERKTAEVALRNSEAYLAEAQRLSHTGSFGWKLSSGEIFWSEESFRIFQCDPKTKPTLDFILSRVHREDHGLVQQQIERASRHGEAFDFEHRLQLPDGSVKHVRVTAHPSRDTAGNLVEFVGAVTDVSKQRQAEAVIRERESELQENTTKLEEAQRITHVGYWEWDILTGRVNWSDETYRIYGMQPQERPMDIAACQEKIYPEDWQRGMEEALGGGARFNAECRVIRPNGEVRIAHFQGDVKRDTSGQPYHMFGTVQDITEQRHAEAVIREQESELRQILDLVPQVVAVFGPRGERLYANRIGLDYAGLSLEEWRQAPGTFFSVPSFIHPDDRERVARTYSDNARSLGSAHELELRLPKRDGTYRWFLVRFNPLRDEQGQITRWYVAYTDIEDRKRAEDRLRSENVALREEIDKASMFEEIIGTSPALQTVLSRISKVAPSDSTVLITGETGTGKELVARAIHRRSDRASRAFVSANCAAIPRDLIASELFGHEKGAFTGATEQRLGRFELANGGTLFLDEVGELPAETQIALLRVLQEHEFERVGGTRPIRADVRIIAATNRDLQAAISAGSFRTDLFYRLHVFPIEIPPLRERREDIPLLVEYFIDRYARKAGKHITTVAKRTLQVLQSYPWLGNIRELQNVIERSVIVCETENFSVDESWLSQQPVKKRAGSQLYLSEKVAAQEKEMIEAALRECQGRVSGPSGAAAKLGIARSTLESKIRSLKINKNRFRA
jgi:PAS domain S-box-containing protein